MLIGKNMPSEFPCFSNIGGWIITDEDHHTHHMVPGSKKKPRGGSEAS
jgi:hypothetical protein